MKKSIVAAASIIVVAVIFLFLSKPRADKEGNTAPQEIYAAAEGKVEIMPGFEVEIGSELEGKIAEFPVKEGDPVKTGMLIARMENRDIQAKLRESEAELAVSRSKLKEILSGSRKEEIESAAAVLESALADLEYERASLVRYRELYGKGAVARESLDEKERNAKNAEARAKKASEEKRLLESGPKIETVKLHEDAVKKAEATAEYYRSLLDKTLITAPISGKIIRKYLEAGESVTKERALAAIADIERVRVNAEVDETDIGAIRPGDPVEVSSDAFPGKLFRGAVEDVSDYAGVRKVKPNNQARNLDMKIVEVKITLNEKTPLKPGMTVDVKIKPVKGKAALHP